MSAPPVGIDLGTTYSVIAYLDKDGKPRSIVNGEGDLLTPSVVLFDPDAVIVGKEAVKAAGIESDRVASHAKRDMGSPLFHRKVAGEHYPPEAIQSLILEKLKQDAERVIGPVTDVVITVPAFFNEPRRKATQDAGRMAGLKVLDIINEPTAAALVYGLEAGFLDSTGTSQKKETVLVYDLGGGTFDVTLMEISGNSYKTIATAGDVRLGGLDWDERLVNHMAEQFTKKYRGQEPRENPAYLAKLMREAEDAKRALSIRDQVMVTLELGGDALRIPVTRETFESLTSDLLERTIFTTRTLIREAGLSWSDLTRLLLVGGSSRMPAVAERLEAESGLKVDRSLSPDEAIAHGAALYAGFLQQGSSHSGGRRPPTHTTTGSIPQPEDDHDHGTRDLRHIQITNVNSHSLGVLVRDPQTKEMRNAILIPRNTALPTTRERRFRTSQDNQRSVTVRVMEGEDLSGKNCTQIGSCVVDQLPPGLPVGTPVYVSFTYGHNGRLVVNARVGDGKVSREVEINRKG